VSRILIIGGKGYYGARVASQLAAAHEVVINFAVLAWFASLLRFAKRPLTWALKWQLVIVRAWLLRSVESRVELVAIADRNTTTQRACSVSFADGQQSTALGVVLVLTTQHERPR
jgi:hypothetical protein